MLYLYGALSENDKQKLDVIDQLLLYSFSILLNFLDADSADSAELNFNTLMNNANAYERLAERFSEIEIDIDYIKRIDPENSSGSIF